MFRPCPKPEPKVKKPYQLKRKKKPTGEGILFDALISTKPHISFVSGEIIPNISYYNCHHVLPKGNYPDYRLFEPNIVFLTNDEHSCVHSMARSDLITDPNWVKYFDYFDKLKIQYNDKT